MLVNDNSMNLLSISRSRPQVPKEGWLVSESATTQRMPAERTVGDL